ncbi:tyrosine-type recombinase/integrase [Nocardia sp. NPDC051981]|uniref:tyrosine-type recombinase/integrase n=1 Tax=Nocardia sp. NPDC051981 TaxID=3155417 RepID=UPI003427E03B
MAAGLQERKRDNPPSDDYEVGLIFPSFDWTLRDPVNADHQWRRVREALGLPDDLVPYTFRTFMAVALDDAGLSAQVVADVLQHADPAMTQRKYMARGRDHHHAATILHELVMGDPGASADQGHDGKGRVSTFVRLS